MPIKFHLTFLSGVLLGGYSGAQAVFEGPHFGPGQVVQLDAPHALPLLEDIRFLPLEISGRTGLDSLNPSLAQLRYDIPGANRVLLPGGAGSLYRYHTVRTFGQIFGFLLIDADGTARVVFEFAGYGVDGLLDPFGVFCAIEGSTLWITSVPEVGGDLFEIDLVAGTTINRTMTLADLTFHEQGMALFPGYGIVMTASGPLRLDRNRGLPELLSFEGLPPAWFAPDIVSSYDATTFAFIAGSSETDTHIFYGRADGVVKRASDTPTGMTSAGFAYDTVNGPWLALSTDGSVCAWISQGNSRELFIRELEAIEITTEFQVTHDVRFTDTLNDSGVIAFFSPESLVVLVGDDSGNKVPKIEDGDLYRVDVGVQAGPLTPNETQTDISNLSGTSGDSALPFLSYGSITNLGGIYRVPGFDGLVALDEASESVVAVDWSGRVSTLVTGVVTINALHPVGMKIVLNVQMAAPLENNEYQALYRFAPLTGVVSRLGKLPPGGFFSRPAISESGHFAAIANADCDFEWLGRITLASGTTEVPLAFPAVYGPAQWFTPDGALLFTVEFAGLTYFVSWGSTGLRLLGYHPQGFVLPGL